MSKLASWRMMDASMQLGKYQAREFITNDLDHIIVDSKFYTKEQIVEQLRRLSAIAKIRFPQVARYEKTGRLHITLDEVRAIETYGAETNSAYRNK